MPRQLRQLRKVSQSSESPQLYSVLSPSAIAASNIARAVMLFGNTVNYTDSQAKGDCDFIATVVGTEEGFAYAEMRGRFKKYASIFKFFEVRAHVQIF